MASWMEHRPDVRHSAQMIETCQERMPEDGLRLPYGVGGEQDEEIRELSPLL